MKTKEQVIEEMTNTISETMKAEPYLEDSFALQFIVNLSKNKNDYSFNCDNYKYLILLKTIYLVITDLKRDLYLVDVDSFLSYTEPCDLTIICFENFYRKLFKCFDNYFIEDDFSKLTSDIKKNQDSPEAYYFEQYLNDKIAQENKLNDFSLTNK